MVLFNISGSAKLWEISGGKGCGPEFAGIHARIDAEDWKEALYKTMVSMDLEWTYDLNGEWIEVENRGECHRFFFVSNPEVQNYVGDFDIGGTRYRGVKVDVEDDGFDVLPPSSLLIDIVDAETGFSTELSLSEFMPSCIVDAVLSALR